MRLEATVSFKSKVDSFLVVLFSLVKRVYPPECNKHIPTSNYLG